MRPPSAVGDRLRRIVGIGVTVLLLGGAVAFFLGSPRGHDPAAGPAATPGAVGSTGPSAPRASGSPSTGTTAGSGATTAPADATSGPGRTEPGVELTASPQTDGSWDVVEQVRLAEADDTLTLVKPRIARLGGDFAGQAVRIDDLQASADGQVVGIDRRGSGWRVEAASPARVYLLRYVLSGATVRSVPSTAGRALSVLAPLSRPDGGADRVRVVTTDAGVHSLQCPLLSGDGALCEAAAGGDRRSTRSLPQDEAMVLVQYDLPAPQ